MVIISEMEQRLFAMPGLDGRLCSLQTNVAQWEALYVTLPTALPVDVVVPS